MSYDIRFCVRAEVPDLEGDPFVVVHTPELDSPTYNLREIFVRSMGWDYHQGECYPMAEALAHVRRGYEELREHGEDYRRYEPDNGWGTVDGAIRCMENWIDELTPPDETDPWRDSVLCRWPIEALWWRW